MPRASGGIPTLQPGSHYSRRDILPQHVTSVAELVAKRTTAKTENIDGHGHENGLEEFLERHG